MEAFTQTVESKDCLLSLAWFRSFTDFNV